MKIHNIFKILCILFTFDIKYDKIHIINNSNRQCVTGIVVNNKIQVPNNYRKKIRQEIYYIKKYGINSHLKFLGITNKEKYLSVLCGKINYVLQVNKNDKEFVEYSKYLKKFKIK